MTTMASGRTGLALILGALWVAEITAAFETAMIYAAVGQLIKEFGDPVRVGWLITIYLLIGAAAPAIVARLGDLYGRRRIMLVVLAVTVFASLLSASTSSFALIMVGRGLQGVASAVLPLCFGLARENFSPRRLPIAVGIVMSAASGGTAAGLVIGGYIVDNFGWHAVFYASSLLAILAWILVRLLVPRSLPAPSSGEPLDIASAFLFIPGIVAILMAISNGKDWGWTSPEVLALAAGGIFALFLWIRRSLRLPEPLMDLRLFRDRRVAIANFSYWLTAVGGLQLTMVFSILLQAPTWTTVGLGVSAAVAGLVKLPSNALAFGAGPLSGYLATRAGPRLVMAGGGLLSALGWAVALFFHDTVWQVGTSLCIIAVGTSIFYAAGPTVVMSAVPMERTGEATGMLAVVRALGMAIGAQLIAVLLATSTVSQAGARGSFPDSRAFFLTIVVITTLTLASALAALLIPRDNLRGRAVKVGAPAIATD